MWTLGLKLLLLSQFLSSVIAQDTSLSTTTIAITDTTTTAYCPKCTTIIETIFKSSSLASISSNYNLTSTITSTTTTGWTGSVTSTYSTETTIITNSLGSTTPEVIIHIEIPSTSTVLLTTITSTTTTGWTGSVTSTYSTETAIITDSLGSTTPEIIIHIETPDIFNIQTTSVILTSSAFQIPATSSGKSVDTFTSSSISSKNTNASSSQTHTLSITNSSVKSIFSTDIIQRSASSSLVTIASNNLLSKSTTHVTIILQSTSNKQLTHSTLNNSSSQTIKTSSSKLITTTTTDSKYTTMISTITRCSSNLCNNSNNTKYNHVSFTTNFEDLISVNKNVSTTRLSTPKFILTSSVTSGTLSVNHNIFTKPTVSSESKGIPVNFSNINSLLLTRNISTHKVNVTNTLISTPTITTNMPSVMQYSSYASQNTSKQSKTTSPGLISSSITAYVYEGIGNNKVFNFGNSFIVFIIALLL